MPAADPHAVTAELRRAIRGEVRDDTLTRGIYATDGSHYQIMPSVVVVPRDRDEAIAAVRIAGEHGLPITARGGGTSLSGQTTWTGMILDCSKFMHRLLELNPRERWVRVEPGVIRDELNARLAPHGLHFAPDPATGNRAAVGGMIGNNSSGTRSVVYGKTIDNLLECTVVLADGTVIECKPETEASWRQQEQAASRQAEIHRGLREIVERDQAEIATTFPKVMRRVGGYNLDAFLPASEGGQPGGWNLANLICGSEGTLGVLLDAKLRLHPVPAATAVCVIQFRDLIDSLRSVDTILSFGPSAIELLDSIVMVEARRNPTTAHLIDFLDPEAAAILIVEMCAETTQQVRERMEAMVSELRAQDIGFAWPIREDVAGQKRVWDVRKIGLGLIANSPGVRKGQAFIEDACVPTSVLADYARQVYDICEKHGVPLTTYAHASVGVLHFRPMLDLHNRQDVDTMRSIANECFEIVKQYGGAWSGEHGDGLVRGAFVPKYFGPVIYQAFREVKFLFDPQGIMNPGKIVDSPPMTENLRYGPNYRPSPPPTQFHYRDQGGFRLAVEQCAGIGACRKTGSGTMCPSYMATRDEEHTTRGRANALRLAMSGQLGEYALTSDRLHDVLKLCLSCKACKSECPTSVDMSRLKSEVLHWRHESQGVSWADRLMGQAPLSAAKLAGWMAPFANWGQSFLPLRLLLEKFAGIDRRRPLPKLARNPLVQQLAASTDQRKDTLAGHRVAKVALLRRHVHELLRATCRAGGHRLAAGLRL